jgi:cation:H+ antiporter
MNLVVGLVAFGAGLWLLVEAVETLIKNLRAWALAAGLSGVLVGALVLGFDLESTAAGVAATLNDLPGTALGASIGASIFLVTVGLGTAALIAPFSIAPPVTLLAAAMGATLVAILVTADGRLSRVDGVLLLVAFAVLLAAVILRRPPVDAPAVEASARPKYLPLKVIGALVALVGGAELLVFGTQRIVDDLGLSETVFGLLIVGAAVSFEEVILEALPAFRGFPELSVGNALGTLVFLLTGSLGVIVLARPIDVPSGVTGFHLPALGLTVTLAVGLLARGRLGRPEGAVLIAAYVAYATGAVLTNA